MTRYLIAVAAMATVFALGAPAQVRQSASVLDGSGRRISGGIFTGLTAGGQPGGMAVSTAGGMANYAGFLNTFSLRPTLDTDQDGLGDEVDADNDNDALSDHDEIAGSPFDPATPTSPNLADSDEDGADDYEESVAGTDPIDPAANLLILSVDVVGPWADVTWRSRGGTLYYVHGQNAVSDLPGLPVATNVALGGTAPWYVTTNSYTEAAEADVSNRYYMIRVLP